MKRKRESTVTTRVDLFASTTAPWSELALDMWGVIKIIVCTHSPAIMRARMRRVCKAWRADDALFVTPEWTVTHPDVRRLTPGTRARQFYDDTIRRMAHHNVWPNLGRPWLIQWGTVGDKQCLEFFWPSSAAPYTHKTLCVRHNNSITFDRNLFLFAWRDPTDTKYVTWQPGGYDAFLEWKGPAYTPSQH